MLEPREAIDRLTAAYRGPHPGHRTLHARGTFYDGTFNASADAGELCRAAVLSGETMPVLVRWSNAAGSPRLPDKAPDVRGMAVKFRSSAGDSDLLGQTAPRFPVRTPEDFVSMTEATARTATFPLWVARHPGTIGAFLANARAARSSRRSRTPRRPTTRSTPTAGSTVTARAGGSATSCGRRRGAARPGRSRDLID
jgi:catalase